MGSFPYVSSEPLGPIGAVDVIDLSQRKGGRARFRQPRHYGSPDASHTASVIDMVTSGTNWSA